MATSPKNDSRQRLHNNSRSSLTNEQQVTGQETHLFNGQDSLPNERYESLNEIIGSHTNIIQEGEQNSL